MNRIVLPQDKIHHDALVTISSFHQKAVSEVVSAVASNRAVVVGMAHNPFVRKARRALNDAGIDFKYLEFGNYCSQWKQRLAIKLWSGWPTFPQIFVDGALVGGYKDTKRLLEAKEFLQ